MPALPLPECHVPEPTSVDDGVAWQQHHPSWLLAALRAGRVADHGGADEGRVYEVEVHGLGDLPVPDGRLVGCDPYLATLTQPAFDLALPPGDHPVGVGLVRIAADHVRPTALLLTVGPDPIVRWSLARTLPTETAAGAGPADDPASLGIGEVLGYGVDAGTGALLSPLALPALVEVGAADGGMLEDPLSVAMSASPIDAVLLPPEPGAPAVAQCSSGWGDGVYATWVGWDALGRVSLVMTDFAVVTDPWLPVDDPATTTAPAVGQAEPGGFWSRLSGGRDRRPTG